MTLIAKAKITHFLPQGHPFIMVDELKEQDEHQSISSFQPLAENFFVKNQSFQVAGMLENIAQTAALRSGYEFLELKQKEGGNQKPPVGFIGSVKKLTLSFLPKIDKEIQTKITVKHVIGQVSVIEGQVFQSGEEALKCEMNIFLQEQKEEVS